MAMNKADERNGKPLPDSQRRPIISKLLSLPPNLVNCFHDVTGLSRGEWFCSNDPVGSKLGSGGGSAWLLRQCYEAFRSTDVSSDNNKHKAALDKHDFSSWLASSKRILLHAGGQSRRLPAYAPSGKILTPVPVFRWERGQRLSQDLLSLQIPLLERIMDAAPGCFHTMIVSGDVYIRSTKPLQPMPDVDVLCYGLWLPAETATGHGVFISKRSSPQVLEYMLQKPSLQSLAALSADHYFLTDIGIWLLSDRAVKLLMERSECNGNIVNYDLYSQFGCALGTHPAIHDDGINSLSVTVLPLPGGEFYHFGTSHEIISSSLALQNLCQDQREIIHHSVKPHPSMFVQNAITRISLSAGNRNLWIENSYLGCGWRVSHENIITGVPQNDWIVTLMPGDCIDIVPVGEDEYAVRPYGYFDKFRGKFDDPATLYLGMPFRQWASERHIDIDCIDGNADLQSARIFPACRDVRDAGDVLRFMLHEPQYRRGAMLWNECRKLSADDLSNEADLIRLARQRADMRASNWSALADNYEHSVFYQIDLSDAAREFALYNVQMPRPIADSAPLMTRIHDSMFRSEVARLKGEPHTQMEEQAFSLLREGLTAGAVAERQHPRMSVYPDQIVWARSPVRIDIAGGWTDTPPYCLMEGGSVVNLSVELNGQPPLQAYVKPCNDFKITLRSIDIGAFEIVNSYDQLADFKHVGSPFSIPKVALALAGFLPRFSLEQYDSLESQLRSFGCGIEITTLSAIPAGSGLGTSSVLAATVLAALSDFCGLNWDKVEIGSRTLVLEQLLTTGGGWQDQFGGILQGVKLLTTERGFNQTPTVRYLPPNLFTQAPYDACQLLYYTGITRTAKTILAEIVRRMFLNNNAELAILRGMKAHSAQMYEAIQRADFLCIGRLVGKTWRQNQAIDKGTNPPDVRRLTALIDDLCLGYKLAGAGGGGFLYIVAKDSDAALRIRRILTDARPNRNARFVDMKLSDKGMQVSRS